MPRRYLFLLLLAFGLLSAVYSLTTPLFEAPDEPWHYAYVRWVAEGHGLPRLDDDSSGAYQEVAQPPLYYVVAALISSPVADDDLPELFWHNPQFGYQAGGTVNDNKNMLIHTDLERFPWRGAVLAVRLARFVSLVFGLLTLGATFGLARETLPQHPGLVHFAVGVVAFTPQFLFISGVTSNDSATAATCTGALWAMARIVRMGPTFRRAIVTGLALGLAMLSKTSALLLLPLAVLALEMGRRKTKGRLAWREAALMVLVAATIGGWWYIRNWVLFDDPLGIGVHINTPWGRTEPASLLDLLPELPQVFRSFWGAFGWGHIELDGYLYIALGVLVGVATIGWARHLMNLVRRVVWRLHQSRVTAQAVESAREPLFSASSGIFLLIAAWYLVVFLALLRWMQQVEAPHGRLLFPALGAWGLLLTAGWSGLSSNQPILMTALQTPDSPAVQGDDDRRGVFLLSLFIPIAALFLLSVIVPFAVIRPAFALPRILLPQEAIKRVSPQTIVYDDRARLLGYQIEPKSVETGDRVKVTLCWEALRSMDQDFTLFIHLLGHDNLRVAERTTYPGQGRFPTTLWSEGHAFCDSYWLEVAPWAPAPELYALEIGLYDADTGWRLPTWDATGEPIEPPVIGSLRVTPATLLPRPENLVSYSLGDQIALVGYDSSLESTKNDPAALKSGDTLTLTLYWQALQAPQVDYKVFVHLVDETGMIVTQDDAQPRRGRYPTQAWEPGDLIPDEHQVILPDERPPGPYYWAVGIYHPDTKDRLAVVGPDGHLPNGTIALRKD